MKPIVVSIAPYKFLPAKIGGQKAVAYFYKYFSEHVSLTCLTVAANENELAEGYETIKIFSNSKLRYINPFLFISIAGILKKKKATHLLIEHPYFGWLAIFLKKFTGIQLVVRSHNIEALRFKTLGKWWWTILWNYERWVHRHADYNFFIQEEDRKFAIEKYGVKAEKCFILTYGIETSEPPNLEDSVAAKRLLRQKHSIADDEKILLFTGSFNYAPNRDALKIIEEKLCSLWDTEHFKYKIIVCGPWLEPGFITNPNFIQTGFVEAIDMYFKGADVFINPVLDGGGIKTKLVEALANNCNAVSTINGAIGVNPLLCEKKLTVVENNDWKNFAIKTIHAGSNQSDTPMKFYQHFNWRNITERAVNTINTSL